MIALLRGPLVHKGLDLAVIEASGVGYEVFVGPETLSTLHEGDQVSLHTFLVVREDSLTLYGFATRAERDTFAKLLSVKGVGPKVAFAVLSVLDPDRLRAAVANKDYATLQTVPGIGKRSAERLVLDIGDKLGPALASAAGTSGGSTGVHSEQIVGALVNLGYQEKAAIEVLAKLGPVSDDATALRLALQELGKNRR